MAAGDNGDKAEPTLETGANPDKDGQAAALAAERERRAAKAQVSSWGCCASHTIGMSNKDGSLVMWQLSLQQDCSSSGWNHCMHSCMLYLYVDDNAVAFLTCLGCATFS